MKRTIHWLAALCILWAGSASGGARAQTPPPQTPPVIAAWARGEPPWSQADGILSANSFSTKPLITSDGRFLAFHSNASNLVPGDTNNAMDVFLRDMVTERVERLSVSLTGRQGDNHSFIDCISADGRFVVFESLAANLVPGEANDRFDVFLHDRLIGSTERISVSDDGVQGNGDSFWGCVSDDGRFVSFSSYASNLVPNDQNFSVDVFVRDRLRGVTERASVGPDGKQTESSSWNPTISSDGRYILYESYGQYLTPGDTNQAIDVFLFDRVTGLNERISVASDESEANGDSAVATISDDGRFVAFQSTASNLVPGDANQTSDIFVRDRALGVTQLVTQNPEGGAADGESRWATISSDGRFVIFPSFASNLVPGDDNDRYDIFIYDRQTGSTQIASKAGDGSRANDHSWLTSITLDGRYVVFDSAASNLTAFDLNGTTDIFLRDLQTGTTECISCMITALFFPVIYRPK